MSDYEEYDGTAPYGGPVKNDWHNRRQIDDASPFQVVAEGEYDSGTDELTMAATVADAFQTIYPPETPTVTEVTRKTDDGWMTSLSAGEHTLYVSRVQSQPGRWFVIVSAWQSGNENLKPVRLWPPAMRAHLVNSADEHAIHNVEPLHEKVARGVYGQAIDHGKLLLTSYQLMVEGWD